MSCRSYRVSFQFTREGWTHVVSRIVYQGTKALAVFRAIRLMPAQIAEWGTPDTIEVEVVR